MLKFWYLLLIETLFCQIIAADIYIGKASVDITPELPIALMGQFPMRIANTIETPLTANIIAIESRDKDKLQETAIFVSCDLLYVPNSLITSVRRAVNEQLPMLDTLKIVMNATHTHTAPVLESVPGEYSFMYPIPQKGVTQIKDYTTFLVTQITDGIVKAWSAREKGSIAWGMERMAIGYNRRSVYNDGSAILYGKMNNSDFINIEGYEDHDINALFFFDNASNLFAIAVEVACPAQEVESRVAINADYWHPVRENLKKIYGEDIVLLSWNGASGDVAPHRMYRKRAYERMNQLREVSTMEDIARRIVYAINEMYNVVCKEQCDNPIFVHKVEVIDLPMRPISEQEFLEAKKQYLISMDEIAQKASAVNDFMAKAVWHKGLMERYEKLSENPELKHKTEVHVLRIGDIAVCTNQFELFTDYSIQIQAQSCALQTFVVQLAGAGTYLPTSKAIKGGGYSAVSESDHVGEDGGKLLTKKTIDLINSCW
ncbi:hypothetical protein [Massilibacteroides vaginae]|uniref:hypothetical protein n=1 Tax=Massilibacteroides vaginae TaxID=1673718 RepID=UPI000A1CBA74|nr:hypothetical protein [Massilibacteroides vaginae]